VQADVTVVGADHRRHARAAVDPAHERRVAVRVGAGVLERGGIDAVRQRELRGDEDAAHQRRRMGDEADPAWTEHLLDLAQMLVAGDPSMLRRDLGVGWTAYNSAMWGSPPVVNEHWMTQVVLPKLQPRSVVWGVSILDFVEAETDHPVRTYYGSVATRGGWLGTLQRAFWDGSALIRNRESLRSPATIIESIQRKLEDEPGPTVGHAVRSDGRLATLDDLPFHDDEAAQAMVGGLIKKGWEPSGRQIAAFNRTVTTMSEAGVEVILADMAIAQPLIDIIGAEAYKSYQSFLKDEAAGLGVRLIDLASGASDTRLFVDLDHVNRAGANVFTTVLARAIGVATPGRLQESLTQQDEVTPLVLGVGADVLSSEVSRPAGAPADTVADLADPDTTDEPDTPVPSPDIPVPDVPATDIPLQEDLPTEP
jgi:hypothetical protein